MIAPFAQIVHLWQSQGDLVQIELGRSATTLQILSEFLLSVSPRRYSLQPLPSHSKRQLSILLSEPFGHLLFYLCLHECSAFLNVFQTPFYFLPHIDTILNFLKRRFIGKLVEQLANFFLSWCAVLMPSSFQFILSAESPFSLSEFQGNPNRPRSRRRTRILF